MTSRTLRIFPLLLLVIAVLPWRVGAAAERTPSGIVEDLNGALIEVMRNADQLGYQGRYDHLAPVLSAAFNFEFMAGVSIGRHWRGLAPAQRERLIDTFSRMSIATFAFRFDGFSGERFDVIGEEPAPRKSVLVRNRLTKGDGDTIEINYLLRKIGGRWRVVDIFLDAKYSEMAIKRSEYSAVVSNHGFDSLIEKLEEKLAAFAVGS